MRIKTFLLCTATMALCMGSYAAHAGEYSAASGPRYAPRPAVADHNYTAQNRAEDRRDIIAYDRYEEREPCQNYRRTPRRHNDNCGQIEAEVAAETVVAVVSAPAPQKALLPIVSSYTILFDHDKAEIRADELATIDRALREINKYNPKQITVSGYTDSSGNAAYNQTLSREREQIVSQALLRRGIENQTLSREAHGERKQAVATDDGVRNQQNRRVVIDFRR